MQSGNMASLAQQMADEFAVIEPLQRPSGEEPLTVAIHVGDLHEVVQTLGNDAKPALVGSSWGAMLALVYAARYPTAVASLALVGIGTFDLPFDEKANTETWNDMLRLQAAIHAPALMLHGSYDPHPGTMIYESLKPWIPHLQYAESAQNKFLEALRDWLRSTLV